MHVIATRQAPSEGYNSSREYNGTTIEMRISHRIFSVYRQVRGTLAAQNLQSKHDSELREPSKSVSYGHGSRWPHGRILLLLSSLSPRILDVGLAVHEHNLIGALCLHSNFNLPNLIQTSINVRAWSLYVCPTSLSYSGCLGRLSQLLS